MTLHFPKMINKNKVNLKIDLKVKISNIRVEGKDEGYFYFDWEVTKNGKTKKGKYDSSWSSQSNSSMRNTLNRGYAAELAICQYFGF